MTVYMIPESMTLCFTPSENNLSQAHTNRGMKKQIEW